MAELDPDLLGPCAIYCGYCGVHLNGRCEGCGPMTRKRAKEGKVFCGIVECASKKGVEMCAECADYPCDRLAEDSGDDFGVYSKAFVSYIKEDSH